MAKISKCDNPFLKDDWSHESLQKTWEIVEKLAKEKYKLDFYNPHFEIVSFEDMLHIYTGSMPIMYEHWSFGKAYEELYKKYRNNRTGIAYEVIFNTNPALCYLLEHNSPTMQGLVFAHAAVGHSAFFKNNFLFKEMTKANQIIPFLKNAKQFISECEVKYGNENVSNLLDACHALSLYAIDRMPKKEKTNAEKRDRELKRIETKQKEYDKKIEAFKSSNQDSNKMSGGRLREENILKFISKFAPTLKPWEREIIRIYCHIQQYLYPQMQTKLSNEGFASFWHYTIMQDLADQKILESGNVFEFLHSHCAVLAQPTFDSKYYYGINPYKLGFSIYEDIKRICTNPTEEDKEWFPHLIGKDWVKEVQYAAYNFKDSSFVLQYLSPKVMRDFKLFVINDNQENEHIVVSDIHDDEGYKTIRRKLSESYDFSSRLPDIYVEGWDVKRTRKLYVVFQERDNVELNFDSGEKVANYIKELWKFPIVFKYIKTDGTVQTSESPD